ncbi:Uncharacterized protein Rs2_03238 [Raphanus sativus]|nr:Uncharacterized protein Rs2_03238 [Raphanus sativus]
MGLPDDDQMIGALTEMEIGGTSNNDEGAYDAEMMLVEHEDDLMGDDLMELEAEGSKSKVTHGQGDPQDHMASKPIEKPKASSSHRSGGRSRIPLGLNRKAQFLRRGSPKPHKSSSREIIHSGR